MSFLRKIWTKIRSGAGLMALVVMFLAPMPAFALDLNFVGIGGVVFALIAKILFYVTFVVSWIGGVLLSVVAYGVDVILQMSIDIAKSPIVTTGFPIMLSIANLGFVLGLIVIAVATILQLQNYGMKQLLVKLVAAAILINFGLVITGFILKTSDSVTLFLIRSIIPTQNTNGSNILSPEASLNQFATEITGAFNPQTNSFIDTANKFQESHQVTSLAGAFDVAGQSAGELISLVIAPLLSVFSLIVIFVVLVTLAMILLIRYVELTFLLITLPLAWIAWPFPALKKNGSEWWKKFVEQAFKPIPIVFTLYLALILAQKLSELPAFQQASTPTIGDNPLLALNAGLLEIAKPVAINLIKGILIGGTMLAGLVGSGKLGKKVGEGVQKAAQATGKAVGKRTLARASKSLAERRAEGTAKRMEKLNTIQQNFDKNRVLVDEHGQAILKEAGRDIWGNVGLKQNIITDDQGKKYAQFTRNADGTYVDKDGNVINGATVQQGYVTADGKILNTKRVRDVRGVAVTEGGRIVSGSETVVNPDGTSKIVLTNKDLIGPDGRPIASHVNEDGEADTELSRQAATNAKVLAGAKAKLEERKAQVEDIKKKAGIKDNHGFFRGVASDLIPVPLPTWKGFRKEDQYRDSVFDAFGVYMPFVAEQAIKNATGQAKGKSKEDKLKHITHELNEMGYGHAEEHAEGGGGAHGGGEHGTEAHGGEAHATTHA